MSYETRLEGTLALHPFPEEGTIASIRAGLAGIAGSKAGRLVLTPLGHGVVAEGGGEWEAALEAIERSRERIFKPLGIKIQGSLRAVGEDGVHLATITFSENGTQIDRHGASDDTTSWIEALRSEDPNLREDAATQLASCDPSLAAPPLASAAVGDSVEAVRCKALEAIGELGEAAEMVVDDVARCLSDPSPRVRYWATFALGRLGPSAERVLPQIQQLTGDSAEGPRYGAIDAVRRIQRR